jgi:hypothetical protein
MKRNLKGVGQNAHIATNYYATTVLLLQYTLLPQILCVVVGCVSHQQ